jgi:hypothetical protein
MIRFARTALILLVSATSVSQKVASGKASQTATAQHSEIGKHEIDVMMDNTEGSLNAGKPTPNLNTSNEALSFRRNAQFYSWRGNCYTQDRDQNWYQIDARLC